MQALLDELLACSTAAIETIPDPARMRPVDYPLVVGDAAAFRARDGLGARLPFAQTVRDTLDDWRAG